MNNNRALPIYISLLHSSVKNQNNEVITTSITNLDVHDLARLTATYDLAGFFIVQPLQRQRELFSELIHYWKKGKGAEYNSLRSKAFENVRIVKSLNDCMQEASVYGELKMIATGAQISSDITCEGVRELTRKHPVLIVFGTGWGLSDEIVKRADYRLEPIKGRCTYNHLSVRSAASIIIDRIYRDG
ncbi:MAG: RNA methyltransferase [Bacillota bacterium]